MATNNKKLIYHFETLNALYTRKLSADASDTTYTIGATGSVYTGEPDIPYTSLVYISDSEKLWTCGRFYDNNENTRSVLHDSVRKLSGSHYKTSGVRHCISIIEEDGRSHLDTSGCWDVYTRAAEEFGIYPTLSIDPSFVKNGTGYNPTDNTVYPVMSIDTIRRKVTAGCSVIHSGPITTYNDDNGEYMQDNSMETDLHFVTNCYNRTGTYEYITDDMVLDTCGHGIEETEIGDDMYNNIRTNHLHYKKVYVSDDNVSEVVTALGNLMSMSEPVWVILAIKSCSEEYSDDDFGSHYLYGSISSSKLWHLLSFASILQSDVEWVSVPEGLRRFAPLFNTNDEFRVYSDGLVDLNGDTQATFNFSYLSEAYKDELMTYAVHNMYEYAIIEFENGEGMMSEDERLMALGYLGVPTVDVGTLDWDATDPDIFKSKCVSYVTSYMSFEDTSDTYKTELSSYVHNNLNLGTLSDTFLSDLDDRINTLIGEYINNYLDAVLIG